VDDDEPELPLALLALLALFEFARLDPECGTCNLPREITIPEDHYYMMGDNRGESADSREWGPVPKKWIIGKAFMTYWPPGRIGLL